jgi:hypothetical protein
VELIVPRMTERMNTERIMPCCRSAPPRTVSDLFDRGHRRSRSTSLAPETPLRTDPNGLSAWFVIEIENGTITAIGFKASTCVTLIAYCELIAEIIEGQDVTAAAALSPALLVANLTGVPALKRDRAVLAVNSFQAALTAANDARERMTATI